MEEAGLITVEGFNEAVSYLADRSAMLEDGWLLENHQSLSDARGVKVLKKSSVKMIKVKRCIATTSILDSMEDAAEDLCDREAAISISHVGGDYSEVICRMEHHVLYSFSYCVPTIFFNIYKPDGSLVSLEDLWFNIKSNVHIGQNLWSVVTQQEHPLLHRPFYHLHPCHTAELLNVLQSGRVIKANLYTEDCTNTDNNSADFLESSLEKHSNHRCPRSYLIAWLSTVAPLTLLPLSHHYATD